MRLPKFACVLLLLAGCVDPIEPEGIPVNVWLVATPEPVEQAFAVDTQCLVFTRWLSAEEAVDFMAEPAMSVHEHIGRSVRACMSGQAVEGWHLPQATYADRLWINTDGECQPGAAGCYHYKNPTIDRSQAWPPHHEHTQQREDRLLGHEIWHAVAGSYHP